MQKPDSKDFEILDYIKKQINVTGFPPSVREICSAVGLSSTSTVANRLKKLQIYGYLEKNTSKNRSLRVVNYPVKSSAEYIDIPMYGKSVLVPDSGTEIALPREFVGNKDLFILQVKDSSMINSGILPGDYVIVNHQSAAENGDTVVVLVDPNEEATVKTFYREHGHFRLQPENDTMEPIIADDICVIGKVIAVFRRI